MSKGRRENQAIETNCKVDEVEQECPHLFVRSQPRQILEGTFHSDPTGVGSAPDFKTPVASS
jgi:hypothetical protein